LYRLSKYFITSGLLGTSFFHPLNIFSYYLLKAVLIEFLSFSISFAEISRMYFFPSYSPRLWKIQEKKEQNRESTILN